MYVVHEDVIALPRHDRTDRWRKDGFECKIYFFPSSSFKFDMATNPNMNEAEEYDLSWMRDKPLVAVSNFVPDGLGSFATSP